MSVIALVLLLAAPGLLNAAVLDVPGSFATIQAGIDTAAEGDTVLVAPGIYYENLNLTGKSITLASHYITTGDTMYMHETVIDGNKKAACLHIESTDTRIAPSVIGFTVQNGSGYFEPRDNGSGIRCVDADPLFEWLIVTNCSTYISSSGGGFNFVRSNPVLKKIHVINNKSSMDGGGLSFSSSNPVLDDVNIIGNHATSGAGGIYFSYCDSAKCERMVVSENSGEGINCSNTKVTMYKAIIINNTHEALKLGSSSITIVNSTLAAYVKYYDPCIWISGSHLTLVNSIIWRLNSPEQIVVMNTPNISKKSYIHIVNTDFLDGISSIKGDYKDEDINADIYFSDTNIMVDPLFIDPYNDDFSLQKDSPCIDNGLVYYELNGEIIVSIPESEFIGSAPDIGAYEFIESNSVEKEEAVLPSIMLLSPFPNPFNTTVTIPYRVQTGSNISLTIYNCTGQKVAELTDGFHATGMYSAVWNAEGCASGVYYCLITDGHSRRLRKIQYLK